MAKRKRKNPSDPKTFVVLILLGFFCYGIAEGQYVIPVFMALLSAVYAWFRVRQRQQHRTRTLALSDLRSLSPRELELHVAAVLDALPGWSAHATRGGSDQGADVIATGPGNVVMAVQVKHYSGNVGNKAVQEIVASKAIYRASEAVVFTSGPGYTASARELARANDVRLWLPADLFALQANARAGSPSRTTLFPG